MSKKLPWIIVGLMIVGLVGLSSVQIHWIHKAALLKEQLFQAGVQRALNGVVQRIETKETQRTIVQSLERARTTIAKQELLVAKAKIRRAAATTNLTKNNQPVAPTNQESPSPINNPTGTFGSAPPPPPGAETWVQSPRGHRNHTFNFVVPDAGSTIIRDSLTMRYLRKLFPAMRMPRLPRLPIQNEARASSSAPQEKMEPGTKEKKTLNDLIARREYQKYEKALREATKDGKEPSEEIKQWIHETQKFVQQNTIQIQVDDSVIQFSFTPDGQGFKLETKSAEKSKPKNPTPSVPAPPVKPNIPAPVKEKAAVTDIPKTHKFEDSLSKMLHKFDMVQKVMDDLNNTHRNLYARLDTSELEFLLAGAFKANDISYGFEYGIVKGQRQDSLMFVRTNLASGIQNPNYLQQSPFTAQLFPNDVGNSVYHLCVRFPDHKPSRFIAFSPVMFYSAGFILIVVGCFGFTMFMLVRQKKLSDMKTDFINNMTHELKTPIATIAIASEALKDDHIRNNTDRVSRFVTVIHDENKRLAGHVEKVLQAAVMDRGELKLRKSCVNLHGLIEKTVQSLALQIEQKHGVVFQELHSVQPFIEADEQHLTNVIFNLLDNANKYSPENPRIIISTHDSDAGLLLAVEDSGTGMSKEEQKNIFEKFYRVPTGNRHDVKGFGLGLSYVHSIVQAHGGTIRVQSEPGKGSRFEILLPRTIATENAG